MRNHFLNLFIGLLLTTTILVNAMENNEINSASPSPAECHETEKQGKWSPLNFSNPLPKEIAEIIIPSLDWGACFSLSQTCRSFLPLLYQFIGHIPFKVLRKPEMMDHLSKFIHFETLTPLHEQVFAVTNWWINVRQEFKKSSVRWEDLGSTIIGEKDFSTFHDAKYENNAWNWKEKYTYTEVGVNNEVIFSGSTTLSHSINVKDTISNSIKESFSSYIKILLKGPSSNLYGHPPCDGSEAKCALKNKNPYIIFSCYCTSQLDCQPIINQLKPVMKKLKTFLYSAYLLEIHSKKKENLPDEKFEDFLKSFDSPPSDVEKFLQGDF